MVMSHNRKVTRRVGVKAALSYRSGLQDNESWSSWRISREEVK